MLQRNIAIGELQRLSRNRQIGASIAAVLRRLLQSLLLLLLILFS